MNVSQTLVPRDLLFFHSTFIVYIVPYVCLALSHRLMHSISLYTSRLRDSRPNTPSVAYVTSLPSSASARLGTGLWDWDKMTRRPSAASVTTVSLSPIIVERSNSLQPLSVLGSPGFLSFNNMRLPSRTVSLGAPTNQGSSEEAEKVDSEANELFTMNSVAQVKEIQRRLRYDQSVNQRIGYLPALLLGMTRTPSKKS